MVRIVRILLAVLILAGCGIPCDKQFDLYARGLCVDSNGYDVKLQNLEASIDLTEYYFNRIFDEYLVDIDQLLIEHSVVLGYFDDLCGLSGRVIFPSEGNVKISVLGSSCWLRNYVVTHEILHIIAKFHLHIVENGSHLTPRLFVAWADHEGLSRDTTVEYNVGENIAEMCDEDIESNPKSKRYGWLPDR